MISELFPSQTHNTRDILVGEGVDNTIVNHNVVIPMVHDVGAGTEEDEEDELQISASQLFFKNSGGLLRGSSRK